MQFKLQNSLPAKNSQFDSRIVIKMPAKMTRAPTVMPFVKNLDGSLLNATISIEENFEGCSGTIVCYSITHSNLHPVPARSTLRFSITGTTNQESQQEAGAWEVRTQIREIAPGSTGGHYNIDGGLFQANWTAKAGGIVVGGQATKSSSYVNYFSPAKYTIYLQLQNYIPAGGQLEVAIPAQVKFISSPFPDFSSSDPNLVSTGNFTDRSFKLKATGRVGAGVIEVTFGGLRNPMSYQASDVFKLNSSDAEGFPVGRGSLDNILMSEPALFPVMTVSALNQTNGATTEYTVSFIATVPLQDGDLFSITFPPEIKTPRDPVCEMIACVESTACTSERGRIVVTLGKPCPEINSVVTFKVQGLRNPPSLVPRGPIEAHWTTSRYRQVANFTGAAAIQNAEMAFLNNDTVSLNQLKLDFGVQTVFTLRFRPTNSIPRSGWIKVVYPRSVSVADELQFIAGCMAITTLSFRGPGHCNLVSSKREIWMFDLFGDQETYSSTVTLEFNFTNPVTNFFDEVSEYDKSFHITTYDFETRDLADMVQLGYT